MKVVFVLLREFESISSPSLLPLLCLAFGDRVAPLLSSSSTLDPTFTFKRLTMDSDTALMHHPHPTSGRDFGNYCFAVPNCAAIQSCRALTSPPKAMI